MEAYTSLQEPACKIDSMWFNADHGKQQNKKQLESSQWKLLLYLYWELKEPFDLMSEKMQ
jgi:hypothetical protein